MERWKRPHHRGCDPVAAPAAAAAHIYHPSFSSSLLDAIDRSIDKSAVGGGRCEGRAPDGGATRGRLLHCAPRDFADMKKHDLYGRRAVDPLWHRGTSSAECDQPQQRYGRTQQQRRQRDPFFGNSTSSSSESSYGGFSSSEAESVVLSAPPLPKPVRTGAPPARKVERTPLDDGKQKEKTSIRSRFQASKFYGELKKGSRAPVSPGARLASFLNTLFSTAGNPKKAKISTTNTAASGVSRGGGGDESACSSASSCSRSCLSKTPSSRGRAASSGGSSAKRSVRFYPVSVIVDEDCRPCGQKCLYENEKPDFLRRGGLSVSEPPLTGIRGWQPPPPAATRSREGPPLQPTSYLSEAEERKRAREAAMGLIGAYKEKKRGLEGLGVDEDEEEEEEDDDDDAASYSSSDLFELKNLTAVGRAGEVRYRDELPVYETTRLDMNRAIARGLIV